VPNTAWLAGTIELDDHGFILTGPAALYSDGDGEKRRRPRRQPGMLETSQSRRSRRVTCAVAR
jgi:thioredoxin reductase (NADPH)